MTIAPPLDQTAKQFWIDSPRGAHIGAFWGLIGAKCFLVEYAVQQYGLLIDSRLFIWWPSILIGGLCTILYLFAGMGQAGAGRAARALSVSLLVAVVVVVALLGASMESGFAPVLGLVLALLFAGGGLWWRFNPFFLLSLLWLLTAATATALETPFVYQFTGLALLALLFLPSLWHIATRQSAHLQSR